MSVSLGWSPRICISYKFPVDADCAGLGSTLRISLLAKSFALKVVTLCGVGDADMGIFLLHFGFAGFKDYWYEINMDSYTGFYTLTSSPLQALPQSVSVFIQQLFSEYVLKVECVHGYNEAELLISR